MIILLNLVFFFRQRFFCGIVFSIFLGHASWASVLGEAVPVKSPESDVLKPWQGKPFLLHFWASWCKLCRSELHSLDMLTPHMRTLGADVVAVLVDGPSRRASDIFLEKNVRYLKPYCDQSGTLCAKWKACRDGFPVTIFINHEGVEVFRVPGAINWNTPQVAQMIQQHLHLNLVYDRKKK